MRLYHFLTAFGEKCHTSKVNSNSGHRYWIFSKSERLDKLIAVYGEMKHKFS
jgi:hypothetical protein